MTGSRRSCRGSLSGTPTRFLPVKGVDRARGPCEQERDAGDGRGGSDAQCLDGQRPLELSLPGHPEGRIRRLRSPEYSRPGHSTRRSASRTKNHPAPYVACRISSINIVIIIIIGASGTSEHINIKSCLRCFQNE